jgi:hypothetical protein
MFICGKESILSRTARRQRRFGTKPVLGVMVVVMVTMVGRVLVVMLGGEDRAGKNQQEQDGGKNLLHGENVPRVRR